MLAVLLGLAVAGCGTSPAGRGARNSVPRGECPVDPVPVVVSISQWSDLVRGVGGDCVAVTTIVGSTAGDPHEFEPKPSDLATIDHARFVVVNGLGYDAWATGAVAVSGRRPAVVDAGVVAGVVAGHVEGDDPHVWYDPHIWYDPQAVDEVTGAVSRRLVDLLPGASEYLRDRVGSWTASLAPYHEALDRLAGVVSGGSVGSARTYVATEPLFDATARAVGLRDLTPAGYRRSSANGSEPTPGDVAEIEELLRSGEADVLIVNRQTEGAMVERIRAVADRSGVPIVEVAESPPAETSFVEWQTDQLRRLTAALTP